MFVLCSWFAVSVLMSGVLVVRGCMCSRCALLWVMCVCQTCTALCTRCWCAVENESVCDVFLLCCDAPCGVEVVECFCEVCHVVVPASLWILVSSGVASVCTICLYMGLVFMVMVTRSGCLFAAASMHV